MNNLENLLVALLMLIALANAVRPNHAAADQPTSQSRIFSEEKWHAPRQKNYRVLFSVHLEAGSHSLTIDYSSDNVVPRS